MGVLSWIIAGGVVGFLAPKAMKYKGHTLINIVVGIIGGFLGGLLVGLPGGTGLGEFNYRGVLLAILFAIFFVGLVNFTGLINKFNKKNKRD